MGLLLLILALIPLCYFLTRLVLTLTSRYSWLDDIPNERSSHTIPTPKGGGAAFVIGFLFFSSYCFATGLITSEIYLIIMLAMVLALLGFIDDVKQLGIRTRITVHALVALIALYVTSKGFSDPLLDSWPELKWLGYIIALLGFVWFINLFNFMDGIDGIAAVETIFVSVAAFSLLSAESREGWEYLLPALAACLSGFFILNKPPALIFMGDIGSNFLGYILGTLALVSIQIGTLSVWTWCILLAVFIADSTVTLISRMIAGEIWYYAHRTHAYQLLADRVGSHAKVISGLSVVNLIWILPLAWLSLQYPDQSVPIVAVTYLPLVVLIIFVRKKYIKNSQQKSLAE